MLHSKDIFLEVSVNNKEAYPILANRISAETHIVHRRKWTIPYTLFRLLSSWFSRLHSSTKACRLSMFSELCSSNSLSARSHGNSWSSSGLSTLLPLQRAKIHDTKRAWCHPGMLRFEKLSEICCSCHNSRSWRKSLVSMPICPTKYPNCSCALLKFFFPNRRKVYWRLHPES